MVAQPMTELGPRPGTYADVLAAPPGVKAELVDGALALRPQPSLRHTIAASSLAADVNFAFGIRAPRGAARPGGWWILGTPECHLWAETRVVVPDVAGWRRERMPDPPRDSHEIEVPPDWVCEVLSPSTRGWDSVVKMGAYAAAGVTWVWLVEPGEHRVEVYRRDPGEWTQVLVVEGPVGARLPPFEAVELNLSDWWEIGAP